MCIINQFLSYLVSIFTEMFNIKENIIILQ